MLTGSNATGYSGTTNADTTFCLRCSVGVKSLIIDRRITINYFNIPYRFRLRHVVVSHSNIRHRSCHCCDHHEFSFVDECFDTTTLKADRCRHVDHHHQRCRRDCLLRCHFDYRRHCGHFRCHHRHQFVLKLLIETNMIICKPMIPHAYRNVSMPTTLCTTTDWPMIEFGATNETTVFSIVFRTGPLRRRLILSMAGTLNLPGCKTEYQRNRLLSDTNHTWI